MRDHSIQFGVLGFAKEARAYVANIRRFEPIDWLKYLAWIGTLAGLFVGTTAFVVFGAVNGVDWPGYVYNIPIATGIFLAALSVDDIGHRTMYKSDLQKGEGYVHQMIIVTAVTSVMALCLCYENPETMRMPALALIFLSLFYSAIDEAMHWYRYMTKHLDRVEMWSHFFAIAGHVIMIASWWQWYDNGYPGVAEALKFLPF